MKSYSSFKSNLKLVLLLVTSILFISSCSEDSGSSDNSGGGTTTTSTITGVFVDSAVSGIDYVCSSGNTGVTNSNGEYTCNIGDTVTFSIAGITLGTVDASETITPTKLFPSNPAAALNVAQLLQTLDSDGDPSNGITPNADLVESLKNTTVNFTSDTFDVDVQTTLGSSVTLVDESVAQNHLNDTYAQLNVSADGTANYKVNVTVSGLATSGLVLQNNLSDDLTVNADGTVTFTTDIKDETAYSVSVLSTPSSPVQVCTVSNASGTIAGTNVNNITVTCVTQPFTVGITVSGLSGGNIVLQNNGADDLSIANGSFAFSSPLTDGSNYLVSILSQPSAPVQSCTVVNGSGVLAGNNISNVAINCVTNAAPVASNLIIIDSNGGSIVVDDTLTASYAYSDAENNPQATSVITWFSNSVAITGATNNSYTVLALDSGKNIHFSVLPVASSGTLIGSVETSLSSLVNNSQPVASAVVINDLNGAAALVGDQLVGQYTFSDIDLDPESVSSYRWLRDGVAIPGATTTLYKLVTLDSGKGIVFEVTPKALSGVATGIAIKSNSQLVDNSQPTANDLTILDSNGGSIIVGDSLTAQYNYADADGDNEATSLIQWLRNGNEITGETNTSYNLSPDDSGESIAFTVQPIAQTGNTQGQVFTSGTVVIDNSAPTISAVQISDDNGDTVIVGDILSVTYTYADTDSDIEGSTLYQWQKDAINISGATASNYTLIANDSGSNISVNVTPVALTGTTIGIADTSNILNVLNSAPTASNTNIVDVNGGLIVVGDSLTLTYTYTDIDGDSEGTTTYQWLRDGTPIAAATNATYTLIQLDSGKNISVSITPVANTGVLTGSSVITSTVAVINIAPTASSVQIADDNGGTIVVGTTLTGSYVYNDVDGNIEQNTVTNWQLNGVDILGANNSSTYTVTAADSGKTITYRVTVKAATGSTTGEPVSSSGVDVINSAPVASALSINDANGANVEIGDILNAVYSYTDSDADIEATTTYQWLRSGVEIPAQTNASYTVSNSDIASNISFKITPKAVTGVLTGSTVTSNSVAIANSAPTASNVNIVDDNGGQARVGDTLSNQFDYADIENDSQGIATYQWFRDGVTISDSTSTTYTITADDSLTNITVQVTPVALTGTLSGIAVLSNQQLISNSPPVASNLQVTDNNAGTIVVGVTLTGQYTYSDVDLDEEGATETFWQRDGANVISSKDSSTYLLTSADSGKTITFKVAVKATTGSTTGVVTTSSGFLVTNSAPIASAVTIVDKNGGTVDVGDILTSSFSYADIDLDSQGIATYQWFRGAEAITGETSLSYTLIALDDGNPISVKVTPVALSGIISGIAVPSNSITISSFYQVSGSVSGLTGTGLVLQNNGAENLTIDADGAYTAFATQQNGTNYNVSVFGQPQRPNQTCTVVNPAGVLNGSNVTTANINCEDDIAPAIVSLNPVKQTWGGNEDLTSNISSSTKIVQIVADNVGGAAAIWSAVEGGFEKIMAKRQLADGTWQAEELVSVTAGVGASPAFNAHIGVDNAGNIMIVWQQQSVSASKLWYNQYLVGSGWIGATLIDTDDLENRDVELPQIAVASNGDTVVIWESAPLDIIFATVYTKSTNSWSSVSTLSDGVTSAFGRFQVAINASGQAVAVWRHNSSSVINATKSSFYTAASGWSTSEVIDSSVRANPNDYDVTMDEAGNVVAVWVETDLISGKTRIWSNRLTASDGLWKTPKRIETNALQNGSNPQVVMDQNANVIAIWLKQSTLPSLGFVYDLWSNYSSINNDWEQAKRLEFTDKSVTNANTQELALAMNSSGNATAAWVQTDENSIRQVWSNRFISSTHLWQGSVPTSSGADTRQPSIAVKPNGSAIVAFYAATVPKKISVITLSNQNIATDTTVTATFDEAIFESTIGNASFTINNGSAVTATVVYDSTTKTATLTPDALLNRLATYTATLDTSISDATGNTLSPTSWTFTTKDGDWATPELISLGSTGLNKIRDAEVSFDKDGNAMAIWSQGLSGFSQRDIFTSYYDVASKVWTIPTNDRFGDGNIQNIPLNDTAFGHTSLPKVKFDDSGNAVAVWQQLNSGDTKTDLFSNRYIKGSGWQGVGGTTGVSWNPTVTALESGTVNSSTKPELVVAKNGEAMVLYTRNNTLYSNHFYDTGDGIEWFGPVAVTAINSTDPINSHKFGIDSNRNIIAVWVQVVGADSFPRIWVSRYVRSTNTWGTAIALTSDSDKVTNIMEKPEISVNANGDAIVVWNRKADSSDANALNSARYAIYDVVNDSWSTETALNDLSLKTFTPKIKLSDSGKAIAIWQEYTDGDGTYSINSRAYDPSTGWASAANVVSALGDLYEDAIAIDTQGNAVVNWSTDSAGGNTLIYANRYLVGQGWTGIKTLSNTLGSDYPKLAVDNKGNFVSIWLEESSNKLIADRFE